MTNYYCCVTECNNNFRYPEKIVKRGHIKQLKFYYFPKDEKKRELWGLGKFLEV